MHEHRRELNPRGMVVMSMMTHAPTLAKKIIQPVVLGIAMLFMTPVPGLFSAALRAFPPAQTTSNEIVVYKTTNTSVAFKS